MTIDYLEWGALLLAAAFFALLYYLDRKRHVDFGVRTILALGLGIVVGLAFKGHYTYVGSTEKPEKVLEFIKFKPNCLKSDF